MRRLVPALVAGVFAAAALVFALGAMQPSPVPEVVARDNAAHRTTLEARTARATPRPDSAVRATVDSDSSRVRRTAEVASSDVARRKRRPATPPAHEARTRTTAVSSPREPAVRAADATRFEPFVGAVRLRPEVVVRPDSDVGVAVPAAPMESPTSPSAPTSAPPSASPTPRPSDAVDSPADGRTGRRGATRGAGGRSTPQPPYPREARSAGEEGEVVVRLRIGADGRVTDATVMRGDASRRLQDAVLDSVRSWTFEPAQVDGRPVASTVTRRFVFRLKDAP